MSEQQKDLDTKVYKALSQALLYFNEHRIVKSPVRLCVGLSGGLDSTVLLYVLSNLIKQRNELKVKLEAFHVNHGISQNSDNWEQFCNQLCSSLSVPFFSKKLNLSKVKQQSLEADARDARYEAFVEHACENTLIVLAQHENDQAETFLLQLKRGAGLPGLASMPAFHIFQKTYFCRPLLNISQEELVSYANQHSLEWQEDESNKDDRFDRNFLRLNVLPILKKRWPSINKTIARSANNCAQALAVNHEYMDLLSSSLLNNNNIDLTALTTQSNVTKASFVQYWLTQVAKVKTSKAQLNSVLKICDAQAKESSYVLFDNVAIERFQGQLWFSRFNQFQLSLIEQFTHNKTLTKPSYNLTVDMSSRTDFTLNDSVVLKKIVTKEYNQILTHIFSNKVDTKTCRISQNWCENNHYIPLENEQFQVSFGNTSLKVKYQENRPTKSLKTWFQEWQITPLNRLITPVIYNQKGVVAICTRKLRVVENSDFKNDKTLTILRLEHV